MRDHLDQVLATFALILIFSEGTRWTFGSFPLFLDKPDWLSGTVMLPFGIEYSLYRLAIILVGLAVRVRTKSGPRRLAWCPTGCI